MTQRPLPLAARLFRGLRAAGSGTFGPAALGAALLLAALPLAPTWFSWLGPLAPNVDAGPSLDGAAPLPGPWYASLAWLAWIAPVPWVVLIRRAALSGRRPYLALWTAGFLFWLAELYWLTLPYWATSLGWLALSFYLAFYLPAFVGLARVAVHQLRVPVIAAAPVVWTGLELARGHLLTGFTMASLGHTQYRWIELIQVSDLAGAYGVSFLVMFVGACLGRIWPLDGPLSLWQRLASCPLSLWERVRVRAGGPAAARRPQSGPLPKDERGGRRHPGPLPEGEGGGWCLWPAVPAVAAVAAAVVYGQYRVGAGAGARDEAAPAARIALIQGSIDTEFKDDPTMKPRIHDEYVALTRAAVRKYAPVDLVVWPETMFRESLILVDEDLPVPAEWQGLPAEYRRWLRERLEEQTDNRPQWSMAQMSEEFRVPMLLGIDAHRIGAARTEHYNSAQYVDSSGKLGPRYDKMHPVMFGEYIPLGNWLPWIYRLTPLPAGLTPGEEPVAIDVNGVRLSPNICYETVLPHVIRGPILALRARGREPDVLVNLTNDGWFYGSIELDLHLICGVFRAVECRKPVLIAANTGFSASIDADGRILALGPRRTTGTLLAEVRPDGRRSLYLTRGDWPAGACLGACAAFALAGAWRRRAVLWRRKSQP